MENAVVWYYCRAGLYGQMCAVAQSRAAAKRDEESRLLYGIALALAGRVADSLAELEPLTRSDLACPALHAMIHAHRKCEALDREAVSQLESRLQLASREAGERGMAMAARLLVHGATGGHDMACGYNDRLLRQDSTSVEGLALKGWLQLSEGHVKPAAQSFRAAAQDKNNVDAIFGLVATMPPQEGISQLNQLIVRFPNATPPLMEKMRLQVALREWDLAMDTATRVLSQEQSNLVALQARLLEQIAVSGRYQDGVLGLRRLATELERQEPTSWLICLDVAALFSGICSRHPGLLVESHRLAERAVSLAPLELAPLLELGRQCCLAGRYAEADKAYRSAVNTDDSSIEALVGLTSIQLAQNGLTSQVRQQLDFLWEVGGDSAGAELLLMRGQIADGDPTPLLDRAFKVQRAAAERFPYGDSYLRALQPDMLVNIANHYPDTTEGGESKCSILELVVSMCPGHVEAVVGLAQCHIAGRRLDIALSLLKQLTERLDPTNTQAHLLIAHVHIEQEDYAKAGASLELCLSYNLDAQRQPLYHLLAGIVNRHCGDHAAAIHSFNAALSANLTSVAGAALRSDELCWLYVSLSENQLALGEKEAAGATLERAERELSGQEQRDRIAMASSELARRRGDTAQALALLEGLTHPSLYAQACLKRAAIHLEELKDGRAYAACFKQLADADPSTEHLILLGDAYLAIQLVKTDRLSFTLNSSMPFPTPKSVANSQHLLLCPILDTEHAQTLTQDSSLDRWY